MPIVHRRISFHGLVLRVHERTLILAFTHLLSIFVCNCCEIQMCMLIVTSSLSLNENIPFSAKTIRYEVIVY